MNVLKFKSAPVEESPINLLPIPQISEQSTEQTTEQAVPEFEQPEQAPTPKTPGFFLGLAKAQFRAQPRGSTRTALKIIR